MYYTYIVCVDTCKIKSSRSAIKPGWRKRAVTTFRRTRKSHERFVMLDRRPSERFPSDGRRGVCRSTFSARPAHRQRWSAVEEKGIILRICSWLPYAGARARARNRRFLHSCPLPCNNEFAKRTLHNVHAKLFIFEIRILLSRAPHSIMRQQFAR